LDDYRLESVLGEGGFGVTYLAVDTQTGSRVAIKEYFPFEFASRLGDLRVVARSEKSAEMFQWGYRRFEEEADRLAGFRGHPNIVRVDRILEANGTIYFVMEYADGDSLQAILERDGTVAEETLLPLTLGVINGLAAVHARRILHRDIKPDNIYVRRDGTPLLLDFGAARQDQRSRALTGIVAEGYSPLEQYSSDTGGQGPFSDIYALAATIYHAVSGRPPPPAPRRRMKDTLRPAREVGAGAFPGAFLDAVDWALAVLPEHRPQDVETWRAALFAVSEPEPGPTGTDASHRLQSPEAEGEAGHPAADFAEACARATSGDADAVEDLYDFVYEDDVAEQAFALLLRIADAGHAHARYRVGNCLQYGLGAAENIAEAANWYRLAARQDHGEAQYELGFLYEHGDGVPQQNTGTAAGWYRKAADNGVAAAMQRLGGLYEKGTGVQQDMHEALRLYRAAAEEGDMDAQFDLGRFHEFGHATARDIHTAIAWYTAAAEQDHDGAAFVLGMLFLEGTDCLPRDRATAVRWLEAAAAQGNQLAENRLGDLEAKKRQPDPEEDIDRWAGASSDAVRQAAAQGNAAAQWRLATLCLRGDLSGTAEEAADWLRQAARQGHAKAQYDLAMLFASGRGVAKNEYTATGWFTKAAANGHADARRRLEELGRGRVLDGDLAGAAAGTWDDAAAAETSVPAPPPNPFRRVVVPPLRALAMAVAVISFLPPIGLGLGGFYYAAIGIAAFAVKVVAAMGFYTFTDTNFDIDALLTYWGPDGFLTWVYTWLTLNLAELFEKFPVILGLYNDATAFVVGYFAWLDNAIAAHHKIPLAFAMMVLALVWGIVAVIPGYLAGLFLDATE